MNETLIEKIGAGRPGEHNLAKHWFSCCKKPHNGPVPRCQETDGTFGSPTLAKSNRHGGKRVNSVASRMHTPKRKKPG